MVHRLVANALDATFRKGDAIAIVMPMTVHAVIIYLAIVLAGLVVVSIADSFAAKEIATRLLISKAKGIFTQVNLHISTGTILCIICREGSLQKCPTCLFFCPHH